MGNALYSNWTEAQEGLYGLQQMSSNAVSAAFGTVVTHYAISEWIWDLKCEKHHNAPVYILSIFVFWALWALVFNANVYSGYGGIPIEIYIASGIVGLTGFVVNLFFSWQWYHWNASRQLETNATAVKRENEANTAENDLFPDEVIDADEEVPDSNNKGIDGVDDASALTVPTPTAPKERVDYINNIKIFLTNVVILHHCAANFGAWPGLQNMTRNMMNWSTVTLYVFTATNASYFMNLFFFYSGYFVPKSYDKKGRYAFLLERAKRLGIPFVVYSYFLGPYVFGGLLKLFFNFPFPTTPFDCGVTWFLNQLLLFSILYAFVCGSNWYPKIRCPSILSLFVVGSFIGLATGIILLFTPNDDLFFMVPQFWADYLSYPIYFFGGAIAQRNNWMDDIIKMRRSVIYSMVLFSITVYAAVILVWEKLSFALARLLIGIVHKGILSMAVSLAVSVFFMDHVNRKYFCTEFFSKAMYTAYIIQFVFPMLVALKLLFVILDSTGQVGYDDDGMYIINDSLIFPGWLFVGTVTMIIVWPMAYAIQAIPGFSEVL